jgi:mannose-6-phosphate isomerase-like protein (cupin superfamily)
MMNISVVNLHGKLNTFSEYWSPKIIGNLNGQHVKIAKVKGDFVMHTHEAEDELFYVVKGSLFIELEDQTLEIREGEFVIIPKGTAHKPYAPEEVHLLLFEPASTLNTGNIRNEFTVEDPDMI